MTAVGGPARLAVAMALMTLMALALAACSPSARGVSASTGPMTVVTTAAVPGPGSSSRYRDAIDAAAARGLRVWLEADLVKRWLAGPGPFAEGVGALARLATRPGVVGIKVADELGYHYGLGSDANRLLRFLTDTRAALDVAAPGKQLLVDFVIPDLGCAPGLSIGAGPAACTHKWDAEYPALSLGQLDRVFSSGAIDVADISTGLETDATYSQWGIDRNRAQTAAWAEIGRRGWGAHVRLQGRKALAHPGAYAGGVAQAAADARTFIDVPLASGARAVDIWAWQEPYQGRIVRLMDPGLAPNPLWDQLVRHHRAGDVLFTHFTPSQVDKGVGPDLDQLVQGFTDVYMAAGIG
jgi:hypothetical protein